MKCPLIMNANKNIVSLIAFAIAWQSFCLHLHALQNDTPVEYVVEAERPRGGLSTVSYRPSVGEKPFFQKLASSVVTTGGLAIDYSIRNHDAQYVGWFGIVRKITIDQERHETRLLVEHKYFDGLGHIHIHHGLRCAARQ